MENAHRFDDIKTCAWKAVKTLWLSALLIAAPTTAYPILPALRGLGAGGLVVACRMPSKEK